MSGQRVVLVTGGGRGLGRSIAEAFAGNGDAVVVCGRTEAAGSFYACDVRDPEQVAALVDAVVDDHGRLDVVVNNAGGTPYAPASTMSPRLAERVVALNLLAPFYVAQRANAVMQDQPNGGVIINIGSTAAYRPAPNSTPYVAAKAGLIGLTRALAVEWAPKVRVNLVTPGLLRTELVEETYGGNVAAVEATVPMGRMASGSEVGQACLMLASPAATYISGSELVVDGGGEYPSWHIAAGGALG